MGSLVNKADEATGVLKFTRRKIYGKADAGNIVLINYSNNPMEVLFAGAQNVPADSLSVMAANGSGLLASMDEGLPQNGINLSASVDTILERSQDFLAEYAGTDSLASRASGTTGVATVRIILMPGEYITESTTSFTTSSYIDVMFRYITNVEVV